MQTLTISLIQADLVWENKAANLEQLETMIAALPATSHVVVLPEMFSTGFSMQPQAFSEAMDGPSVQWMADMAARYKIILTGSLIINDGGMFYNRLIWMQPDGRHYHYDKRHLFAYAGEDKHYAPGDKRLIVQVNGWKICLLVCYDLRFPVWSRQTAAQYDMLIYVANWPERRSHAWNTLLRARAIENQCYVAGVNRVGYDGHEIYHSGDTCLLDPLGQPVGELYDKVDTFTTTLEKSSLDACRKQFPFLGDADKFMLL